MALKVGITICNKNNIKNFLKENDEFKNNIDYIQTMGPTFSLKKKEEKKSSISFVRHASYDINLVEKRSVNKLVRETKGDPPEEIVVFHVGKKKNMDYEKATSLFIENLKEVMDKIDPSTTLLLETPAGQGSEMFTDLNELKEIYNIIKSFLQKEKTNFGICVDTCHAYSSGIPIKDLIKFIKKNKEIIKLIHLNDSKTPLGSGVDRHAPLTEGTIFKGEKGIDDLKTIVKWCEKESVPLILETPLEYNLWEIELIKELKEEKKINKSPSLLTGKSPIKTPFKNNKKIIKVLKNISHLEISKGSPKERFKRIAFRNAIKTIEGLDFNITRSEQVKGYEGIGKGILERIDEILKTGEIKGEYSSSNKKELEIISKLTEVDGIGDKLARELYEKHGIKTIKQLNKKKDTLHLPERVLNGLRYYTELKKCIPRKDIRYFEREMKRIGSLINSKLKIEMVGSYRRGKEGCGDIDILISSKELLKTNTDIVKGDYIRKILGEFGTVGVKVIVLSEGKNKASLIIEIKGIMRRVDMMVTIEKEYPTALLYFTGNKAFNIKLRKIAIEKGYKLSEHGLFTVKEHIRIPIKSERDIFKKLGIEYVKPFEREM